MHYNSANTSRFHFSIADPSISDELRLVRFDLEEHLSDHFQLNIEFVSENHSLSPNKLIKKSALLTIDGENDRQYVHGIINELTHLETGNRFSQYKATIVPLPWFLNYRKGCRIFQNKSVSDIINTLFFEAGLIESKHFRWDNDRKLPRRTYCTQYNETEWDFISRLVSEEGIHFHYQHSAQEHIMILGDSKTVFQMIVNEPTIVFHYKTGLTEQHEHINHFSCSKQLQPTKSTLRDYNFMTPNRSLEQKKQTPLHSGLEDYQCLGHYLTAKEGEFYAKLIQQQHDVQIESGVAKSNIQRLRAGRIFSLTGHRYKTNNSEHLITSINMSGRQPQSLDEDSPAIDNQHGSTFFNQLETIPAKTVYRPPAINKTSLIHGQQYAIVTGPEDEEIYLNEYGQIKIQFLWDRHGQHNEKTSCWIRVNNEQSGKLWGQIMPPRVGQQVLVEFEQGDPDRPMISGRCYNGDSLPPYSLPTHKTRGTTKSNSTPGGQGYNEIRFEDKKSQEQIYFHSEKDLDIHCKNDKRETIGNTRSLTVDNEQFEHIKAEQHQKVEQNEYFHIGRNLSQNIGERHHIKLGQKFLQQAGNEIHIKSGNSTVFDAGSEITFKASGGFIKIDPSGVTINGIKVDLNSGGSADSASISSPDNPFHAVEADKDKPGQTFKPLAPQIPYQLTKFAFAEKLRLGETDTGGCSICNQSSQQKNSGE